MKNSTLRYNTSGSKLVIPEYGRNIQRLIEHAQTIEEKDYRQAFVEKIVDLMIQMHPQARNVEDYRNKIWYHVFLIADFKLDVDSPVEVSLEKLTAKKPARVPYPKSKTRYRHYGKNVHSMVQKAMEMEDVEKKQAFANVIGAYMKMAYKTWNRESVSHDIIKLDLENMSKGELTLSAEAYDRAIVPPSSSSSSSSSKKSRGKGGRNSGGSNSKVSASARIQSYKRNSNSGYKRRKK